MEEKKQKILQLRIPTWIKVLIQIFLFIVGSGYLWMGVLPLLNEANTVTVIYAIFMIFILFCFLGITTIRFITLVKGVVDKGC